MILEEDKATAFPPKASKLKAMGQNPSSPSYQCLFSFTQLGET